MRLNDHIDPAPVTLVARRLGTGNTKLSAFLDWIRDESGAEVRAYMVVAPADMSDDPGVEPVSHCMGVAVLPSMAEKVGLQRIFRHPIRSHQWELPRGFVERGEEPAVAGLRELREETGLVADPSDVIDLGLIVPEGGIIRGRYALFAAMNCRQEAKLPEGETEIGLGALSWFSIDEALSMADRSEIADACTCMALYRFARVAEGRS